MEFDLAYGQKSIKIEIPDREELTILCGKKMPPLETPEGEIRRSLQSPINSPPLSKIVNPGERVAILVSDRTRTTLAHFFLPVLIEELNKLGIMDPDIFIIFANGTHRLHSREEQEKIIGQEIARRIKFFDHDCHDENNFKYIGTTSRGTAVKLNKKVLEADRLILTGGISYHYFAGYGGGRKSILPGIAAFKTVQANHRLVLEAEKKGLAKTGKLEGNPIHEDMEEAAKMIKPDFIFNVVVNEERELCGIFAGELISAHRAGCKFIDEYAKIKIDKKVDLVIVSAGGGTCDMNFVQSHKAMEHASFALKEGGTMILIAESKEGYPSEEYTRWFKYKTLKEHEEALNQEFTIPGHTMYAARLKCQRFKIFWLSKMRPEEAEAIGAISIKSIEEVKLPAGLTYLMPQGYTTFPYLTRAL